MYLIMLILISIFTMISSVVHSNCTTYACLQPSHGMIKWNDCQIKWIAHAFSGTWQVAGASWVARDAYCFPEHLISPLFKKVHFATLFCLLCCRCFFLSSVLSFLPFMLSPPPPVLCYCSASPSVCCYPGVFSLSFVLYILSFYVLCWSFLMGGRF